MSKVALRYCSSFLHIDAFWHNPLYSIMTPFDVLNEVCKKEFSIEKRVNALHCTMGLLNKTWNFLFDTYSIAYDTILFFFFFTVTVYTNPVYCFWSMFKSDTVLVKPLHAAITNQWCGIVHICIAYYTIPFCTIPFFLS